MMLAHASDGERIPAAPNAKGKCPVCHQECIPKCGEVKTWHWAHKSLKECDSWYEPESEWHYGWKKWAGLENTEIVIKKDDRVHRADIRTPSGVVIELQHSPLSTKIVREREDFYKNMVWVVDGDEVCPDLGFNRYVSKDDRLYFKHSGISKAWVNEIKKPLYVHFGHAHYKTYYYYNEYRMLNTMLSKHLKKTELEGGSGELKDFLLKMHGKYCEVVPGRLEFFMSFGPYHAITGMSAPKKQKSMFSF